MTTPALRNDSSDFLAQALGGIVAAHPDATWHADPGFVSRAEQPGGDPAPVGLVSGGGSGHEPLHVGFIGAGMLTAACPGLLFTSPNALQVAAATRWADAGRGVVHIVKNYTGDVMNFHVARESLAAEGVRTDAVLVDDDVATESEDGPGRRGTAATIVVEKVCGAAAERGDDLEQVVQIGRRLVAGSRSMAVALEPGRLPTADKPTFDLEPDSMELGAGIHGEQGVDRLPVTHAAGIVDLLLARIAESLDLTGGDRVICVVNGLGATHGLELGLVFGEACRWLAERDVTIERSLVGSFVTAVDTSGVTITLCRVDDELLELFDAPTAAPAWPNAVAGLPAYEPARTVVADDLPDEGDESPWLSGFVERVQGAVDELTELDRTAGDGDFGTNMNAALGDLQLPLRGPDAQILRALADRYLVRAGGTSGAVFGTLFRELAAAWDADDDPVSALAAGLHRAADAITELGGAQVGDRTMIDALAPAAQAARACADEGADLESGLQRIHEAAHAGALTTADLAAGKGRASYLGDAATGVPDPGAIVTSWLFGGDGQVGAFTAAHA